MAAYPYEHYYLAGHSLGGLVAADYAGEHPQAAEGVFLLAGYPNQDITAFTAPVIFIYGDCDGVLRREKLEESAALVSEATATYIIEGGNHSGFGAYGLQKGDGEAAITMEEQCRETAEIILSFTQETPL